jgi:hypothetical protein
MGEIKEMGQAGSLQYWDNNGNVVSELRAGENQIQRAIEDHRRQRPSDMLWTRLTFFFLLELTP